ncbi:hypothetical protein OG921_24765 [Aldersonia sp. NBC_00410]|uniref:hypothetical protein n=1 Tax=Aldersonia sp. NBC_00410 TaxID=2975954 RepID=UPI00225519BE|nr:hypothetical protein [Aldersonia sp. NBC_00410]MCX5046390.1 hypothetical protein [Aldersonia sp. NBC_00410]
METPDWPGCVAELKWAWAVEDAGVESALLLPERPVPEPTSVPAAVVAATRVRTVGWVTITDPALDGTTVALRAPG